MAAFLFRFDSLGSIIAKIGTDGSISIYNNSGSTHVIVDIFGGFAQ